MPSDNVAMVANRRFGGLTRVDLSQGWRIGTFKWGASVSGLGSRLTHGGAGRYLEAYQARQGLKRDAYVEVEGYT